MKVTIILQKASIENAAEITDKQKEITINRVVSFERTQANSTDLVYFNQGGLAKGSKPGVIITTQKLANNYQNKSWKPVVLISSNPKLAFATISQSFNSDKVKRKRGKNIDIHDSAVIDDEVEIGNNSKIDANCTIYNGVVIGDNVRIFAGSVVGADGFGTAIDNNKHIDIKHLGKVEIGNNVTIGARTTIDRATLNNENTVIADGVKIDNLVHIAHNVNIGDNTVIAAKVGVAGSADIGKNCFIGGMAGISQGVKITDGVTIVPTTHVHKNITTAGKYAGNKRLKER